MRNIFKKKKYLDCPHLKHTLHFFYDNISACPSNIKGVIFNKIDDRYLLKSSCAEELYNQRKNIIKKINSFFLDYSSPVECKHCTFFQENLITEKVSQFENIVNEVYIQNFMGCNAKCTYCTYSYCRNNNQIYEIFPILNELVENNILSKCANVFISGGEPTISPEFEKVFSLLINYLESKIEVFTSCIKYSKSIEDAFKKNKVKLLVSLDSSNSIIYKKIKKVDAFDKVILNLKSYISASENAKNNVILKYIVLDGVNDKLEDIYAFLDLVASMEIKNVMFSFDYEKYKYDYDIPIPEYYYEIFSQFSKYANKLNLNVDLSTQAEAVMKKYRDEDF